MSQVITNAFETYWQGCLTDQVPVVLDEVVLADIPNLDISAPIDPNTGLPPEAQIVHRHPVDQRGRINNNAVAYSIVMDTTVGNFSFNAMYLVNKANGMVGMIVYKGRETKTKTDPATGTTGNSLVKSMLMEYDQAATATVTTVEAGTWQIDYSARLNGMEEQQRLHAIAIFGASAFFGDGFKLVNKANAYKVQPGVAMVGGLRIQLDVEQVVAVGAKPVGVWVDVHRAGTILNAWDNHVEFKTSTVALTDYTDANGYRHYVAQLGVVEADATVTDKRGASDTQSVWAALDELKSEKASLAQLYIENPVGIPQDWPLEEPPEGWICCMGQAFDKQQCPRLAKAYPSGVLPDLRGEYIIGWDNGRGVDPDRQLLSHKEGAIPNHDHGLATVEAWDQGVWGLFGTTNDREGDAIVATDNISTLNGPDDGIKGLRRYGRYRTLIDGGNGSKVHVDSTAFNKIVRKA